MPNVEGSGARKSGKKDKQVGEGQVLPAKYPNKNTAELFCGLHLYRCWACKRVLLKPLLCSKCKSVVYCSRVDNINK